MVVTAKHRHLAEPAPAVGGLTTVTGMLRRRGHPAAPGQPRCRARGEVGADHRQLDVRGAGRQGRPVVGGLRPLGERQAAGTGCRAEPGVGHRDVVVAEGGDRRSADLDDEVLRIDEPDPVQAQPGAGHRHLRCRLEVPLDDRAFHLVGAEADARQLDPRHDGGGRCAPDMGDPAGRFASLEQGRGGVGQGEDETLVRLEGQVGHDHDHHRSRGGARREAERPRRGGKIQAAQGGAADGGEVDADRAGGRFVPGSRGTSSAPRRPARCQASASATASRVVRLTVRVMVDVP